MYISRLKIYISSLGIYISSLEMEISCFFVGFFYSLYAFGEDVLEDVPPYTDGVLDGPSCIRMYICENHLFGIK